VRFIKNGYEWFEFDYDFREALDHIITSGCLPDQKSHQFYPTPEKLARMAVELAEIEPDHNCLEPSAGQGGLADFMPKEQTTCVEISKLHCEILKSKEYKVINQDFLKFEQEQCYDRIVMNPPFSEGRWQAHVERAAGMVKTGGRLVAILPAGAKNKFSLSGLDCQWSPVFDNEFDGASVSVVILRADRIK